MSQSNANSLSSGVDFTNILRKAFTLADPKSAKRYWWLDCLFRLLGSAHIKAAHKHVGKIDPWKQDRGVSDTIATLDTINHHYSTSKRKLKLAVCLILLDDVKTMVLNYIQYYFNIFWVFFIISQLIIWKLMIVFLS